MPQLSGGLRWLCCCDEQSNRAVRSNRPADCSSRQAVQPSSLFDAVGYRRLSDESKRRQTISVKQFRWNNFSEIRVSTFKFANQRARCSEFEDREGIETEDQSWRSKLRIEVGNWNWGSETNGGRNRERKSVSKGQRKASDTEREKVSGFKTLPKTPGKSVGNAERRSSELTAGDPPDFAHTAAPE